MTGLEISTQKVQDGLPDGQAGVVAISIKGYLDAYTYDEVEQVINGYFNQHLYNLIVDLSQVEYMTSAGAGFLIHALSVAQENQGNLVLVRPPPNVKEVFDLLGLVGIFTMTDNLESALKTFKG